jgi:hypothetical protein
MSDQNRSKQLESSSTLRREFVQAENDIGGQMAQEIPKFCSMIDLMQISPKFPDCKKIEL